MDAQRKYATTTAGPPILWRPASRKRGRQDELSSDECSSPPRNYCTINQEIVKRGGFSFAPDRSRSTSVSSNQDSYLLTTPMCTEVQLDQEGWHSDTSSTFTSGSDTSEAREQCAYCGRMTRQWILASGGRLCTLPRPECCRDNYSAHGWKAINDMRIKRCANGRFALLSKSQHRVMDGPIGMIIASFLCKI